VTICAETKHGVADWTFQNRALHSKSVLAFQSIGQSKGIVRDTNFSSHFFYFLLLNSSLSDLFYTHDRVLSHPLYRITPCRSLPLDGSTAFARPSAVRRYPQTFGQDSGSLVDLTNQSRKTVQLLDFDFKSADERKHLDMWECVFTIYEAPKPLQDCESNIYSCYTGQNVTDYSKF
jgi:hypothetical protein